MKTLPKTFLVISVISLLVGLTTFGGSIAYGLLRPVAAIMFILFLMTNFLAGEMEKYDEEEKAKLRGMKVASKKPVAEPDFHLNGGLRHAR